LGWSLGGWRSRVSLSTRFIVAPTELRFKRSVELICSTIGATLQIMDRGRPKADRTYSVMLRVRVAPEHDELIRQAAEAAGQRKGSGDLSSWIRETLVAAARKELARS
jgi:hypothetical protein